MQYDGSDSFLTAAFAVVKEYDPKTYARMARDDSWLVVSMSGDYGLGETLSSANSQLHGMAGTRINPANINRQSKQLQIDPTMFTAAVLVHEYRHAHQSLAVIENTDKAESQAFHAGSAFAEKLPGYDGKMIKAISDETLATMHNNPAYIMQDAYNNS
jgi:hypothetical protein